MYRILSFINDKSKIFKVAKCYAFGIAFNLKIYIVLVCEYITIYKIEVPMKDLVQFLTEADDKAVLERRLKALLTPNEINEMQHRLQIFSLLEQGVPQREIAKQLGVGIATVTRGSRALKELKEI